jgi:hypothetical protein
LISATGPDVFDAAEETPAVRGFEARRRAAAAATLASFGGAEEGDATRDGVAGDWAAPDAKARGACLDDARESNTSWASRAEREVVFLRGVTTMGTAESED